ncbi:MAG: glycosyltransferase family 4 protein [candidate division WOR-3 bacterium]
MPEPLRVCQVSAAYYPYPSGLSEHVHYLTGALRESGHQVEILTTSFSRHDQPVAGVTRMGRAVLVPLNKSFATVPVGWNMSGRVKRFLSERQFDIVHLHGLFPPDISFWALRHSRSVTVVTFHTLGFGLSPLSAAVCRWLLGGYNRRLAARIVESRAALEFTRRLFPGEYRLIPPGVDIERFSPTVEPLSELCGMRPVVLFVGRLDRRKGLAVLLEAMGRLRKRLPSARLVVVGTGPLEQECRLLVRKLGLEQAVLMAGFVPVELLPQYYASADVYCSPALGGEAFGLVLLEAMASGVPVIASDIAGYNEVVVPGETGLLFPAGDAAALADALAVLLQDESRRQRMRQACRQRAEQFSWQTVARRIEELYLELLARSGRGVKSLPV